MEDQGSSEILKSSWQWLLFKSGNILESQYKICLARTYLITSQTSPHTHVSKLCWMCRTFASRDFPELPLLCFPISTCKLRILFSFPLFETKLCPFTDIITLYLTTCIWKCYPPCFRHLGLKPDDVGLARCLLLIPRHHEVPRQTCPCFCPLWHWASAPLPILWQHRLADNTTASGKVLKDQEFPSHRDWEWQCTQCLSLHTEQHKSPKLLQIGDQVYKKPSHNPT